ALIDARVTVGGGVDVIVASATINGGIYTHGPDPDNPFQLAATLCDNAQVAPDGDPNKLRFRDLNGFHIQGDLRAGIDAQLRVRVDSFQKTYTFPFAEKVLANFNTECAEPTLASVDPTSKILYLNLGTQAHNRHLHDGDVGEVFTLSHAGGDAQNGETID